VTTVPNLSVRDLAVRVGMARVVVPIGGGTHAQVGGDLEVPTGMAARHVAEVRAPAGILQYDPAELTVTVGAGTTVGDLSDTLAAAGQECPLDPRSREATVGGVLATGLSGPRRLRDGPLRERLLEVRFVTADGRLVKGGGPTVKNVTGYDVPRLMVGSLGTLGVITQVTLRCRPRAAATAWAVSDQAPAAVRERVALPSALLWDGRRTHVMLEGHPDDVAAQIAAGGLTPARAGDVPWPEGPWRGRISVAPAHLPDIGRSLAALDGVRWLAEGGVGTVHVGRRRGRRARHDAAERRRAPPAQGVVRPGRQVEPGADAVAVTDPSTMAVAPPPVEVAASSRSPAGPAIPSTLRPIGPIAPGPLPIDDDELVACVACGLCLPHCPTYRVTGLESASPRGRIAAMKAVQFGGAAIDATFERYMEECIQCRGCEAACPSSVRFGHLMEGARVALAEYRADRRPWRRRVGEWVGFRLVLPHHAVLVALTTVLAIGQRLRLVPRRLIPAGAAVPRVSWRELRRPLRPAPPRRSGAGEPTDAVLFTGCVMDAWLRPTHRAALDVMAAAGGRVALPGRGGDCCGALHVHAGRIDEARRLARRVIASVPVDGPIVVDSAGCGAAMEDYGRLLGTPEAAAFSARVQDLGEWLAARDVPLRRRDETVVVQEPCHLRHVQRAAGPIRAVLARAYDVRDTDDDGLCCGAGGVYSVLQPDLAGAVRDRKVAALRRAAGGAPLDDFRVASANPGCLLHLQASGVRTVHPAELLAEALDPDVIAEEARA
jgi:glycolate oxidase iron-sulfur subunit